MDASGIRVAKVILRGEQVSSGVEHRQPRIEFVHAEVDVEDAVGTGRRDREAVIVVIRSTRSADHAHVRSRRGIGDVGIAADDMQ